MDSIYRKESAVRMDKKLQKYLSKKLSYVLRHHPEDIGIIVDKHGWTDVPTLLSKLEISLDQLHYVVSNNTKKRFSLSEDNQRIKANQGHSIPIELELNPEQPPALLYHGTAIKNIDAIAENGLLKMNRHHVHLSSDQETAKSVGGRHGKPKVLTIDAHRMHEEGCIFYQSENGVWLTAFVDAKYIDGLE